MMLKCTKDLSWSLKELFHITSGLNMINFYEVCTMLLISSSFATAGASVVISAPCAAAWCCASCWQTAASNNAETSGVCNNKLKVLCLKILYK